MADATLYAEDDYVFLETGQPEEVLTLPELADKLLGLLQAHPDALPPEFSAVPTTPAHIHPFIASSCDLTLDNRYIQWYAIRLEK